MTTETRFNSVIEMIMKREFPDKCASSIQAEEALPILAKKYKSFTGQNVPGFVTVTFLPDIVRKLDNRFFIPQELEDSPSKLHTYTIKYIEENYK